MPVQTGFGTPDLDFIVTIEGHALRIETKVDGKKPTPRQVEAIKDLVDAGAVVLVIDQSNLLDLAITASLLYKRDYSLAFRFAYASREDYLNR